ncbi:MAG TPA: Crp/Fnr family transcriptional regulator [Flavisolibacter sp.]|nr:Crp/Fnr family transcriptional regulator [Flavisolibacter sp.]
MQNIRNAFETSVKISDEEWNFFTDRLTRQEFGKKTVILRAGKVEKHLSFIEEGIIRFYIPKETDDLTFSFSFQGSFVSAYDSFLMQAPCTYAVECIAPTVLWRISFEDLQLVYLHTKVGNHIGRLAGEDLFLKKMKRELSLLSYSPEQRYLNLFSEQPHLLQKIPLKFIASYIGITPQALSRIRKRIS